MGDTYNHSPVYRIGGDEFVAILRGGDYENRKELLEQIKATVLANQRADGVIVAAGMAVFQEEDTFATVFERADKAMYENKDRLKGERKRQ